jgi:hypothetical protein
MHPQSDEPAGWSTSIEAIMTNARERLPERWARYCRIIGELQDRSADDDAACVWLAKPVWEKEADGTLEFMWLAAQRFGYPNPPSPPGFAERRDAKLRREAAALEAQFFTALLGELRTERWEARATSQQEGLFGDVVPVTSWFVGNLTLDTANGISNINRDGSPWLLGLLLRPKPQSLSEDKEPEPRLRPATDGQIDRAITRVYDAAEQNQVKPPNVNEVVAPVQAILVEQDRQASGEQIKRIAEAERHKARRLPPGQRFSKRS